MIFNFFTRFLFPGNRISHSQCFQPNPEYIEYNYITKVIVYFYFVVFVNLSKWTIWNQIKVTEFFNFSTHTWSFKFDATRPSFGRFAGITTLQRSCKQNNPILAFFETITLTYLLITLSAKDARNIHDRAKQLVLCQLEIHWFF